MFGIDTGPLVLAFDTWVDRFCPSSQAQVRELQASLNAGSAYPPLELGIFTPCGESRRIHLLIEPHPELPGAWMGLVIARGCCQEAEHREHALREKIRQTEEFWPQVIDQLQIGLWNWNIRTNEVERTRQWNRLLGIRQGDDTFIAHWEERIHPEDREACARTLQDYFDGRMAMFENEYRILDPDGEYRWIADRGKIIEYDEDGEPVRMCGFIMDITHQKRLQALHENREIQFRAVFNSLFHFVGLLNTDGTILECNQAVYAFSGLPQDHMKGVPIWEGYWWSEDATRLALKGWIQRAAAGELVRNEVELVNHQGVRLRLDFTIRPVTDNKGAVLWLVTEGRETGTAPKAETSPALSRIDETANALITASPDAVAMINLQGRFMAVSDAFSSLVGYPQDILQAMSFKDITHPEDIDIDIGYMQGLLDGKCDRYNLEKRYIHQDGSAIPVQLEGSVMRDRTGEPLHFIARVTDLRPAWHEITMRRAGAA